MKRLITISIIIFLFCVSTLEAQEEKNKETKECVVLVKTTYFAVLDQKMSIMFYSCTIDWIKKLEKLLSKKESYDAEVLSKMGKKYYVKTYKLWLKEFKNGKKAIFKIIRIKILPNDKTFEKTQRVEWEKYKKHKIEKWKEMLKKEETVMVSYLHSFIMMSINKQKKLFKQIKNLIKELIKEQKHILKRRKHLLNVAIDILGLSLFSENLQKTLDIYVEIEKKISKPHPKSNWSHLSIKEKTVIRQAYPKTHHSQFIWSIKKGLTIFKKNKNSFYMKKNRLVEKKASGSDIPKYFTHPNGDRIVINFDSDGIKRKSFPVHKKYQLLIKVFKISKKKAK